MSEQIEPWEEKAGEGAGKKKGGGLWIKLTVGLGLCFAFCYAGWIGAFGKGISKAVKHVVRLAERRPSNKATHSFLVYNTISATAVIRQLRERRAQAVKQTLQNGITAYYLMKDKWPQPIESVAKGQRDGTVVDLSNRDYDKVMQEILKESARKVARVMDPTGLQIMPATASDGSKSSVDFREAATKNGPYAKRMSTSDMTVVYQKKEDGRAYRYVIEYNTKSDSVTVMTQDEFLARTGQEWTGNEVWR